MLFDYKNINLFHRNLKKYIFFYLKVTKIEDIPSSWS